MFLAIFFSFFGFVLMRVKITSSAEEVDKMAWTPSDFALVGYIPGFSRDCNYSKDSIEKEVTQYMSEKFNIIDIEYVSVAYDIENIYELLAKEQKHQKEKELIHWYRGKKDWTEEQYLQNCANWKEHEGFPLK